jgi:heptosyltransferase-2/heptosyltransferase-3
MTPSPARPLVVRFGAFGDMVLMIPVLKLLAARYGQPCDVVASGAWTDPLLKRVPGVGECVYLTSRRAPYWFNRSQQQFVSWLRKRPAGPVYLFEADDKVDWLVRRAGVSRDWICSLRDFPRQPSEHILARGLRLARATPAALRNVVPSTEITAAPDTRPVLSETDRSDCAAWLEARALSNRSLVLIQAGNKKTMKGGNRRRVTNVAHWPETNWAQVIKAVRESLPSSSIILCGAPPERPLADDIVALLPWEVSKHVVVATDDLPIPRLLALQERAHSLISVDTGPAHAAAAMGCPLVVMFTRHAHRSADLYAPVPTTASVKIVEPDASFTDSVLANIPAEKVITAWRELVKV